MHWRRIWQPTPVFLPGESQGREPGGLLSVGSWRVRHDWSNLAAAAAAPLWIISFYSVPITWLQRFSPCLGNYKRNSLMWWKARMWALMSETRVRFLMYIFKSHMTMDLMFNLISPKFPTQNDRNNSCLVKMHVDTCIQLSFKSNSYLHEYVLSHAQFFATPWTAAHQAPLSMGFPRQEYWSGYFLFQGIFLIQGSNPHFQHLLHYRWILYHWAHQGSPSNPICDSMWGGVTVHILKGREGYQLNMAWLLSICNLFLGNGRHRPPRLIHDRVYKEIQSQTSRPVCCLVGLSCKETPVLKERPNSRNVKTLKKKKPES